MPCSGTAHQHKERMLPLHDCCRCCAAAPIKVQPEAQTGSPGSAILGNILDNVQQLPAGTTASVAGLMLPGATTPIAPESPPVTIVDPATGAVAGTLTISASGDYAFTAAPDFTGDVPPVTVTLKRSDGVEKDVPLVLTVKLPPVQANEYVTAPPGASTVQLNVLGANPSPSLTGVITSFTLPGSSTIHLAGETPVTVMNAAGSDTTGTVVVRPDGNVTLTRDPGFSGQVPPITFTVQTSDGQTSIGSATVVVPPGAWPACRSRVCQCSGAPSFMMHSTHAWACVCARARSLYCAACTGRLPCQCMAMHINQSWPGL